MNQNVNIMEIITLIKLGLAFICTLLFPTVPVLGILLFAHIIDVISAIRLNHRLYKADKEKYEKVKLSSDKFRDMISDFGFEVVVIALVALIGYIINTPITIAIYVGYLMIFGQIVSILENESECSRQKWSKWLNSILKSKSNRYLKEKLGIEEDII